MRLFERPGRIVKRVGNVLSDVCGEIVVRAPTEPLGSPASAADDEDHDGESYRRERATTEPLAPIAGGTPPLGVRIDASLLDDDADDIEYDTYEAG